MAMFKGITVLAIDFIIGALRQHLVVQRPLALEALEALLMVETIFPSHLLRLEDLSSTSRAAVLGVALRVSHDDGCVRDDLGSVWRGDDLETDSTIDVLIWSHRDHERIHGTGATLAGETSLVVNLLLDSELLGLVHSTSTTWTALSVALSRLDGGRIRIDFGTFMRTQLEVAGLAEEVSVMGAHGEGVQLLGARVALEALLVETLPACWESFCIVDGFLALRALLDLHSGRHLELTLQLLNERLKS